MIYTLRDELHGAYLRALREHNPNDTEYIQIAIEFCQALASNDMLPDFSQFKDCRITWLHIDETPYRFTGQASFLPLAGKVEYSLFFFPKSCELYARLSIQNRFWKWHWEAYEWTLA